MSAVFEHFKHCKSRFQYMRSCCSRREGKKTLHAELQWQC